MRRHTRKTATALLGLGLGLFLTGCAGDPDRSPEAQAVADAINVVFHHGKWRQIPATPENQVETIIFEQRVAFAEGTPLLDRTARQAVDRLLEEARPDSGSLINLSVPAAGSSTTTLDRLTLQRLEAVRVLLADRGYPSALATDAAGRVAVLGENEVGLTVSKVMAVLPDCSQPQPLEPDRPDFSTGFGCANTNNLGVMVANPADLERGRPLEPADAEAHSLPILRYRIGEPKPLEEEDTKSQ